MFSTLVGVVYSNTWLVPTLGSTLGLIAHLIRNITIGHSISEQVVDGIAETTHYLLMLTFFYMCELGDRFLMYECFLRQKENSGTMKIFKELPNPLVVFNESTEPLFWNSKAEELCVDSQVINASTIKEMLTRIKAVNGTKTAMNVILEHYQTEGQETEGSQKYKFETNETLKTYTIKSTKIELHGKKSLVMILQDETGYENLIKIEEKYQKMYVASIVHDIRTPLNGIMGIIEIIEEQCNSSQIKEHLKLAKNTCMQLLFLTYDITDYSQIEAKKLKINTNEMDIKEVVYDCTQLLNYQFERKKIKLTYSTAAGVPAIIYSDKNRYMQILLNYLSNALKFTSNGEVNISLEYEASNDLLTTIVSDTGVGIRESDIPKLFKMFGKLGGPASSVNPNGVGFGLSICKKLAEAMGGYVSVKSHHGVGSSFSFAIKGNVADKVVHELDMEELSESPKATEERELISSDLHISISKHTFTHNMERRAQESLNGITSEKACLCPQVLHVDDSECNRHILKNYCATLGIAADEVSNGQDALETIVKRAKSKCCQTYKVVLMDINMPILNGIEATLAINRMVQDTLIPKVPIVAVTAGDLEKDEEEYYFKTVGFAGYAPKPISKKRYTELLKEYEVKVQKLTTYY
eukprot:TRINITY_DN796_c0_g1_i1.p1 TRINITY_DN796_c0_g1~~TRINITY_DN796_c0_g1_i1.p1  ORF type:complete len:638 (-),score=73.60 TRINITY_DN796_c0_g1_i1:77-1990(-)